jgi:hypothetical protein
MHRPSCLVEKQKEKTDNEEKSKRKWHNDSDIQR